MSRRRTPERGTDLREVLAEAPCVHFNDGRTCAVTSGHKRGAWQHPECAIAALTAHLTESGAIYDPEQGVTERSANWVASSTAPNPITSTATNLDPKETT